MIVKTKIIKRKENQLSVYSDFFLICYAVSFIRIAIHYLTGFGQKMTEAAEALVAKHEIRKEELGSFYEKYKTLPQFVVFLKYKINKFFTKRNGKHHLIQNTLKLHIELFNEVVSYLVHVVGKRGKSAFFHETGTLSVITAKIKTGKINAHIDTTLLKVIKNQPHITYEISPEEMLDDYLSPIDNCNEDCNIGPDFDENIQYSSSENDRIFESMLYSLRYFRIREYQIDLEPEIKIKSRRNIDSLILTLVVLEQKLLGSILRDVPLNRMSIKVLAKKLFRIELPIKRVKRVINDSSKILIDDKNSRLEFFVYTLLEDLEKDEKGYDKWFNKLCRLWELDQVHRGRSKKVRGPHFQYEEGPKDGRKKMGKKNNKY